MTASYPMPMPERGTDRRFTAGLVIDVARVLEEHGYPDVLADGQHLVDLRQALFGFLYEPSDAAVAEARRQILDVLLSPEQDDQTPARRDPCPSGGSAVATPGGPGPTAPEQAPR